MKIVSKFHDYYDSLVNFGGTDNSKVYVRVTKTLDRSMFPPPIKRPSDLYLMFDGNRLVNTSFRSSNNNVELESFLVIFAGVCYTGIKVRKANMWPNTAPNEETYHYSFESLSKYLDAINPDILEKKKKLIMEFYTFNKSLHARDWAISHKIVTATDCCDRRDETWVVDSQLSKISFQKALDPYTAFQELEMWIGGVLTENKAISQVPNDIKIQQAGFDLVTSFRKPKQS